MMSDDELNKKDIDSLIEATGITEVLNQLASKIQNKVFLKEYHFNRFWKSDIGVIEVELAELNKLNLKIDFGLNLKIKVDKANVGKIAVDRLIVPIMLDEYAYGALVIYCFVGKIDKSVIEVVKKYAELLSLQVAKRFCIFDFKNGIKSKWFKNIVIPYDNNAVEKNGVMSENISSYTKYAVMSVGFKCFENKISSTHMAGVVAQATKVVSSILSKLNEDFVVFKKDNRVYMLLMWNGSDDYNDSIQSITSLIKNTICATDKYISYQIAVGRVYDDADKIANSFKDVNLVFRSQNTYYPVSVTRFDEIGSYKILCNPDLKKELVEFYKDCLHSLEEYDKKRDTELIKSLEYYFEMNGNLKKMSEALFTHYNTILYRMNRIQEITGKNLDDENDRYELHTALKIMKML